MTAKTKILLFVLIAVLIFAGYFATAYSEQARNSGVDILFDVLHSVFFAAALFILVKVHPERWIKIIYALLIVLALYGVVDTVIDAWPRLPWVKAEAFATVDAFLTNLKEQDYAEATVHFTPRMQNCVAPDDLNQLGVQPVQWALREMRDFPFFILGTATFSDGRELSLMVRMVWTGAQWQIDGFGFGMELNQRLDYFGMHCGE